jgi:septation ring formation regulator EzrA
MAGKKAKSKGASRRAGSKLSGAEKAAYSEIKQGVKHLEKSIGEITKGLRKTEKAIEADARARIRALRIEARTQLGVLKSKRTEIKIQLKKVSAAAEGSWEEIKHSADTLLADARATATSVVDRLRAAITR